jgi:L-iditol 2-dehydrogenase
MLAAVFKGPNNMQLENIETPEINEDEVLVKVKACAICGTDIRIYKGTKTRGVRKNSVIGHEISGVVAKVGNNIEEFAEGDNVAIAPVLPCGKCYYCKNGKENACLNRKGLGYEYNGGFAEYIKMPAAYLEKKNLFKFPKGISYEEACLAEPLGCVYNGSERAGIKINDTVVIIGAGPIGLMHLMLAKLKGAVNVIVSEPIEQRRNLAKELGADIVVNPQKEDLNEIVFNMTDDLGADVVILSVGVASLVDPALALLKKGGTLNLFGGFPKDKKPEIDPNKIHYDEVWVTGTTACTRSQYEKALELIAEGLVDLKPIISDTLPLEDINKAIEKADQGSGVKIVVKP